MACSTTKKKTTKPAHVKPLTSSRWSGAKLSKTTEKKINDAYARRKTARRKPAAKKVSEPKLSEKTKSALNQSYTRRRLDKRDAKKGSPRFKTVDLRHIAAQSKKMTKRNIDESYWPFLNKMSVTTKIHDAEHMFITLRIQDVATGYVAIIEGEDAKFGNRKAGKDEFMVETNLRYDKKWADKVNKFVYGVADLEIMVSSLMYRMIQVAVAKNEKRTAAHRYDEEQRAKPHTKFAVGSIYDADYLGKVRVISRTPKTVTIRYDGTNSEGKHERRCNVRMYQGEECIYPEGSGYAHAPVIFAKKDLAGSTIKPDYEKVKVTAKLPRRRV